MVWEPRRGDELESLMDNFYKTINNTATVKPGKGVTGVLFIAVCRGKVSEGLDFADKNARAVVTVCTQNNLNLFLFLFFFVITYLLTVSNKIPIYWLL